MNKSTEYGDLYQTWAGLQKSAWESWLGKKPTQLYPLPDLMPKQPFEWVEKIFFKSLQSQVGLVQCNPFLSKAQYTESTCIKPYYDAIQKLLNDSENLQKTFIQNLFASLIDWEKSVSLQANQNVGMAELDAINGWGGFSKQWLQSWEQAVEKTIDMETDWFETIVPAMSTQKKSVASKPGVKKANSVAETAH